MVLVKARRYRLIHRQRRLFILALEHLFASQAQNIWYSHTYINEGAPRKQAANRLQDSLTGIAGRNSLMEWLHSALDGNANQFNTVRNRTDEVKNGVASTAE